MHPLDILFWSCLALGGAYLVFTVLIGGLSHAVGHLGHIGDALQLPQHSDAGVHHTSHGDVHADHVHHHGDAYDHGHDHGHDGADGEHGGRFNILAYVNPMSLSGFLLGFGGVGVLARMMKAAPGTSALAAGIGGAVMWYSAWFLIAKVFGASEGSSHTRREEVLGMKGTVTAPISGAQPGMVALTVGGSRQQVRAITEEEDPIPVGAQVRIRRLENNTAQVIRLQ